MAKIVADTYEEALDKADMYRRQLGGAEKALRIERQRRKELESVMKDMLREMEKRERTGRGCYSKRSAFFRALLEEKARRWG